jgi:hypothetical protein
MIWHTEYCKNCGKKSSVFEVFALPEICMACHELPIIGRHYHTKTGDRITPPEPSMEVEVVHEGKRYKGVIPYVGKDE